MSISDVGIHRKDQIPTDPDVTDIVIELAMRRVKSFVADKENFDTIQVTLRTGQVLARREAPALFDMCTAYARREWPFSHQISDTDIAYKIS